MPTEPRFIPVFIDANTHYLVMSASFSDDSTWVVTQRATKPSPWLQGKGELEHHDALHSFNQHIAGLRPDERARVLISIHSAFHFDRLNSQDIMTQDDPIGYLLNADHLAIHRYRFAPGESRLSLLAHVHPVWSNARRYQQETKASDTYWRHRVAFQLGQGLQDNARNVSPKTLDGGQSMIDHLANIGSVILHPPSADHAHLMAELQIDRNLSGDSVTAFTKQLSGHTARAITGVNEMNRLFVDGLDKLNSLLSDETVGKAMMNYLYRIKGKLGLQVHGQSHSLRHPQPITLGLELLLALSTGQLGRIELPNKEPAKINITTDSADYLGPFQINHFYGLKALADSLHDVKLEKRRDERVLARPQGMVGGSIIENTIKRYSESLRQPSSQVGAAMAMATTDPNYEWGLNTDEAREQYSDAMDEVFENWDPEDQERNVDMLKEVINEQLNDSGVPSVGLKASDLSGLNGEFDFYDWELAIDEQLLENKDFSQIKSTLYHETRHAEQHWEMARYHSGKYGDDPLAVKDSIQQAAMTNPMSSDSEKYAAAHELYESTHGEFSEEREEILGAGPILDRKYSEAADNYNRLKPGYYDDEPKTVTLEELEEAMAKWTEAETAVNESYEQYINLPTERDARTTAGAL